VKRAWTVVFLCAGLFSCGKSDPPSDILFPCEWPGSPGFLPVTNIDRSNLNGPSGICYHPGRKTLFAVGDRGDVLEMRPDGTPVSRGRLRGDLEDITVDPATGLLYVVLEGDDVIVEVDPEGFLPIRRFPVDRSFQGDPAFLRKQTRRYDNGLEALVFVPDAAHPEGGSFYAGNQEDPDCVVELFVPLKSGRGAEAPARIARILTTGLPDPAAIFFDPRTRLLNVVSDAPNILSEITPAGRVVRQFAFPGNDQEGACLDEEGHLYIAQDCGGILKLKDKR